MASISESDIIDLLGKSPKPSSPKPEDGDYVDQLVKSVYESSFSKPRVLVNHEQDQSVNKDGNYPLLGCFFDEGDKPDTHGGLSSKKKQVYQKYLEKVQTSKLSLLDQPFYDEFSTKSPVLDTVFEYDREYIPDQLLHVPKQVWLRYYEQIVESEFFDFVDFPGVCNSIPIVPMNLDSNEEAFARAKGLAELAINVYNDKHKTAFVVASIDKANCNRHLCSYVDSKKYIVAYQPLMCICHKGPKTWTYCQVPEHKFFITFRAKDEKSDYAVTVTKVFQARVVRKHRGNGDDIVEFCREKVMGSSELPHSFVQGEKRLVREEMMKKEQKKGHYKVWNSHLKT